MVSLYPPNPQIFNALHVSTFAVFSSNVCRSEEKMQIIWRIIWNSRVRARAVRLKRESWDINLLLHTRHPSLPKVRMGWNHFYIPKNSLLRFFALWKCIQNTFSLFNCILLQHSSCRFYVMHSPSHSLPSTTRNYSHGSWKLSLFYSHHLTSLFEIWNLMLPKKNFFDSSNSKSHKVWHSHQETHIIAPSYSRFVVVKEMEKIVLKTFSFDHI